MSTSGPAASATQQQWETIYLAEASRLMRLANVLVGPDDAHDLVIDAVYHVVRRAEFATVADPSAYLSRVLVNAAHASHRSSGRRSAREERAGRLTVAGTVDPGNGVDVQRALARLSPQQRAVAYFTYWEDLGIAEVASRLDVSEGTVRRQLARAKDRLREVLR